MQAQNFSVKWKAITSGQSSLSYAHIPWDSMYLKKSVIELTDVTITSKKDLTLILQKLKNQFPSPWVFVAKIAEKNTKGIALLTDIGFDLIETLITLAIDLKKTERTKTPCPAVTITPTHSTDIPILETIAMHAFSCDRFHRDPKIPSTIADRRYKLWVHTSWKQHTDTMYSLHIPVLSKPIGFFIVQKNGPTALLQLNAIAKEFQGKGYGTSACYALGTQLQKEGVKTLSVSISSNNNAAKKIWRTVFHPVVVKNLCVLHKHEQ